MKNVERTIIWHLDEPGNHPSITGWVMVFGRTVEHGKIINVTKIVYHVKGNGFECPEMQVDYWAEIPRP